ADPQPDWRRRSHPPPAPPGDVPTAPTRRRSTHSQHARRRDPLLLGLWLGCRHVLRRHSTVGCAPVKIAGGLMLSALICLPSLYLFACLGGSQARLAAIGSLLVGLLLLMTTLLIGFAPVAWLFSQSTESVAWMGALHLFFWLTATIFGLR